MTLKQYQLGAGVGSVSNMPKFLVRRCGKRDAKQKTNRIQKYLHRYRILLEKEKLFYDYFSADIIERLATCQETVRNLDADLQAVSKQPKPENEGESPLQNYKRRKKAKNIVEKRASRRNVEEELLTLQKRLEARQNTLHSRIDILDEKTKLVLEAYSSGANMVLDAERLLENYKR